MPGPSKGFRDRPGSSRPCTHARVHHPHGHYQRYQADRCRCDVCRRTNAARSKRLRDETKASTRPVFYVDPLASRRILDGLRLAGWSMQVMADMLGIDRMHLITVYTFGKISVEKAARIRALDSKLASQTPPVKNRAQRIGVGIAKTLSRRRGAVPVMAWTDVEDPEATAEVYKPRQRLPQADAFLEYTHLHRLGVSNFEIARKLNMTELSLLRMLQRTKGRKTA